jgi:hypothetical protein
MPVNPSWLVSAGLVLLAALPHQIPSTGRRILHSGLGAVTFAVAAAWVTTKVPVLGIAMMILLAGVWFHGPQLGEEGFAQHGHAALTYKRPQAAEGFARHGHAELTLNGRIDREGFQTILNKDRVKSGTQWHVETALKETPKGIQDRTYDPAIHLDEIPDHDHRWEVEYALEEHPTAIQDRPVSGPMEYDESQPSHSFGY